MPFTPYRGDAYLALDAIERFCTELAAAFPAWVTLETIGRSRLGRPIHLVTVGATEGDPAERPAFWLDAGTHAAEWTGVMATLYTLTKWAEALAAGDPDVTAWFRQHTAYVVPCMSPDGYQALVEGAPFLRSTLRPPRDGRPRIGLDPCDVDGDGRVLWMRWKSPTGSWIFDSDNPARMRHRTIDDPPDQAYVVCSEGQMLNWDGVAWETARLENGIDLNRNFPSHWAPFEMFGMDSGDYPLSEPESRAVVDAFRARPRIAAAVTNHTYTGCILTQPYRDPSPLSDGDIELMKRMADLSVVGTGYKVFKTFPEFAYDPKKPIVGVWADTMSTVFGVPGYTLELWDPYTFGGVEVDDPAKFFKSPDLEKLGRMLDRFRERDPDDVVAWRPFAHPQLGEVEIGGLHYMQTVRNPPLSELPAECERGFTVADRLRRTLPTVRATASVTREGGLSIVEVVFENTGYLSTSALAIARTNGTAPPLHARLTGGEVVEGPRDRDLGWLGGWGAAQAGAAASNVYPGLPMADGPRKGARWVVRGAGAVTVAWDAGRGGRGTLEIAL
ncbi:MAG: hypothetical protein H6737_27980 [Alphaproteobacteria bacterium]|nr:hypothetical protein [Alphaproteobacteria bacterium]